jgi:hypothetical protein
MIDRPVTVKRRWEVWDPQAGAADPEKTTDLKIMISISGKSFKDIVKKFRKDHTVADLRFFLSTTLHSMGATKPFNIKHRGQLITDNALTLDGAGLVGGTIFVEVA